MITNYKYRNLIWVDISNPTTPEVKEVIEKYKINSLVGEDLLSPSLKPKIDFYNDYIYLILHFPAFRHTHNTETNQEVDFVIGKNFLITTHYDTIDPLHKFSKIFEVNSILDKSNFGDHAGFIFYYMIQKLYKALNHELDFISDKRKLIEERVFNGNEKKMVFELSKISRELLQFKQSLALHDEVLSSFEIASEKFFGKDYGYFTRSIIGSYERVNACVRSNIDTLNELRATNDSLLSTKQNEIMKNIAIISFIFFPLSLVASVFGMNTDNLPFVGNDNDFSIILLIMFSLSIVMFSYFKVRKWI